MASDASTASLQTPTSPEIEQWIKDECPTPTSTEIDRWLEQDQCDCHFDDEATSSRKRKPRSYKTRPFNGMELVHDILSSHPNRCVDEYRMNVSTFRRLEHLLVERCSIKNCQIPTYEQLAIFLDLVGHGSSNRTLAEKYQHSNETISRHIHNVMDAICGLMNEYMQLPSADPGVHPKIRNSNHYFPFFKDAIGAIDGTHVEGICKTEELRIKTRNRKDDCYQNVMAVVNFDMEILYVLPGWEGSAQDMRVLRGALERHGFEVPRGKYYLVDGGYANTSQFVAPYRNRKYHLSEYRHQRGAYDGPQDLFNHRHAQLRNVVERTFGVLKNRFQILTKVHVYSYPVQARLIVACVVLHNFIRKYGRDDDTTFSCGGSDDLGEENATRVEVWPEGTREGNDMRDRIAMQL